ncbi:integrase [Muricauda sp. TY007]|uniref:phage integrase SAM-like domain-containing protein n=1 Tax=Allomuricauda sp. TY007 TaxID=2683200 RepID=UPI0013C18C46|nr:phage integrase SAM-like domain-containing protein [Muricauda sp. TY007]NDV15580.1 integrase [Muricauda sp. TY007]
MSSIRFQIQSKSENANIYVRISLARGKVWKRKTGYTVNPKFWSKTKGMPIQKDEHLKSLKANLNSFSIKLERGMNKAVKNGVPITGEWLEQEISVINNSKQTIELDVLVNYINHIIDTASSRPNQKGGIGLSERRVKGYITFRGVIERFEKDFRKGKPILIREVDLQLVELFKKWLFSKKYSINYVGKNVDNLKAVCNDADRNGIETSSALRNIRSFSEQKEPEAIIYLSEEEQSVIANKELKRDALVNARKWLLLGCLIGQRGSDLLKLTENDIKQLEGIRVIEIKQRKTGKLVAVPLLPEAENILKDGFPYQISLQNFNEYIKEICKLAKLDTPTPGLKRHKAKKGEKKGIKPSVKGIYPKHELIGSHVCRRSFATNFYGRIPTPILINITAHSTEKLFLRYIGKTTYDNAYQMVEYFGKLQSKSKKESNLTVLKNNVV